MMKSRFVFLFAALTPLLFWSCATSKAAQQAIDPIAVLSYSSDGSVPAAFSVIPPSFILPALQDMKENTSTENNAPAAEFLGEFFSRADCVFASIMCNSDDGALFFRVLAFGKFPTSAKMVLTPSRGWQKKEADGATWFESSAFTDGRILRAAIPESGMLLAEIDIAAPLNKEGTNDASNSMADFIAAITQPPQAQELGNNGEGAAFFSAVDAALLGAANVPFACYAPSFNLFARSVLPMAHGFLLAGAVEELWNGFSLPISSMEMTVAQVDRASELLTVRAAVPTTSLTRAAAVIVQLMFPDDTVSAENGAITVLKEMPAGRAALAVLSFFLVF